MKIKLGDWQTAKTVRIKDDGDFYDGNTVESALQEIGSGTTLDGRYLKLDGSNAPAQSITRDVNGVITEWTTSGKTFTPTYTDGLMTSYTDGTITWTISRDVNNLITGVTVS